MGSYKGIVISVALALFSGVTSEAAVLLKDTSSKSSGRTMHKVASDAHSMRSQRRVGIGWGAAGATGLVGLQLELNFTPENSLLGGVGLSRGFRSAGFAYKRSFTATSFVPYLGLGYVRWQSTGADIEGKEISPSFFAEKFLSSKEIQTGEFSENIVYPMAGIQYLQLDGEWAGASFYAEMQFFIDLDNLVAAPNGGVGVMYYF